MTGDTAPLVLVTGANGEPVLIAFEPPIIPGSRWRFERPAPPRPAVDYSSTRRLRRTGPK